MFFNNNLVCREECYPFSAILGHEGTKSMVESQFGDRSGLQIVEKTLTLYLYSKLLPT